MKKSLASIAVFIYFAFACGVIVNYHYCMGRFDSVKLYSQASDVCGKCGMHAEIHGCCHDEVRIVKLEDDHQTSSFSFDLKPLAPVFTLFTDISFTPNSAFFALSRNNHPPPILSGQPGVYILNRVFRI